MAVWPMIGDQLAHPRGWAGRLVGHAMRLVNHAPHVRAIAALELVSIDTVLDLGCGPGHGLSLAAREVRDGIVHGVDQSSAMLSLAQARNRREIRARRVLLHCADFAALPLPDRSVDKILAVNVAYFWADATTVLHELRRILRPGGKLVIYVTHEATMKSWRFADRRTHRLFDHDGLRQLLLRKAPPGEQLTVADLALPLGIRGILATVSRPANAVLPPPPHKSPQTATHPGLRCRGTDGETCAAAKAFPPPE